jgi:release factor glutamine methyltransferase
MNPSCVLRPASCEGVLRQAGIPNAAQEARWIEAHAKRTGVPTATLIERRARREPLGHVLGTTPFLDFEVVTPPGSFCPRPETEILARAVIERRPASVLEIGTGTGCIAFAIARALPSCRIVSVEIDPVAHALALRNRAALGLDTRVDLRLGDLFAPVRPGERFDALVSNPPYIPTAECDRLMPEVSRYEPRGALDGGPDGLDVVRQLATDRRSRLLALEIGEGQRGTVAAILSAAGWRDIAFLDDEAGIPRVVSAVG